MSSCLIVTLSSWSELVISAYIAASDGVHGQQVVAVAQLKLDHLLSGAEVAQLLLLGLAALFDQVFEQQSVFAHPLDGLQQVGRQVHLVPELQLLVLHVDMTGFYYSGNIILELNRK